VGDPEAPLTFETVSVGLRLSTVAPADGLTMPGAEVMGEGEGVAGESSPQLKAKKVASARVERRMRSLDMRGLFLSIDPTV
jgi:hypothetical protein